MPQPRPAGLPVRARRARLFPRTGGSAAAGRGLRLVRDYGGERVEARVDRDQLARAVGNLVESAVAVAPEGGRILVAMATSRLRVRIIDDAPAFGAPTVKEPKNRSTNPHGPRRTQRT